ncbi:hypothetical protein HPB49_011417 [Dermacentor silvarum]|uniref:Uncharacterized protein n=1 Tax=Dermacentor silvarum TaxID=543639 RepID=A0ACB8CKR3_DERSI|nr:hypothetical protein HPB49_011417 [Dermacentor silvarum]
MRRDHLAIRTTDPLRTPLTCCNRSLVAFFSADADHVITPTRARMPCHAVRCRRGDRRLPTRLCSYFSSSSSSFSVGEQCGEARPHGHVPARQASRLIIGPGHSRLPRFEFRRQAGSHFRLAWRAFVRVLPFLLRSKRSASARPGLATRTPSLSKQPLGRSGALDIIASSPACCRKRKTTAERRSVASTSALLARFVLRCPGNVDGRVVRTYRRPLEPWIIIRYFEPTTTTCLIEPWFREIGFIVLYGALLLKIYRILAEFRTRKAHRVCVRDKDLLKYLLGLVLVVAGYMSAWTAVVMDNWEKGHSILQVARAAGHRSALRFLVCRALWWDYVTEFGTRFKPLQCSLQSFGLPRMQCMRAC